MKMEEWTSEEKLYKGTYGDFCVLGIKQSGPHGEVGWHTTSWRHNRSWKTDNRSHDYWVLDSTFRNIRGHIFDPQFGGRNSFVIGDLVEDIDPAERKAVMDAIEAWENPKLDIESFVEEEI
jgi:hypothetical protein